jgi:V/A-type H+/Na+-transporting ATPase subunit I
MIARMRKAFVVARREDRDLLLEALGRLGVVHLAPVNPEHAKPDPDIADAIDEFRRAIQILETTEARGQPLGLSPAETAEEALRIQRQSVERGARLTALHHQMDQLAHWGNVRLDQFDALRLAGLDVVFYAVPRAAVAQVRADFVHVLHPWPNKRVLVATVSRRADNSQTGATGGLSARAKADNSQTGATGGLPAPAKADDSQTGATGGLSARAKADDSQTGATGGLSAPAKTDNSQTGATGGLSARAIEVPEGSEPLPLPARDRPTLRSEAAEIDAALKADADKLAALAHALPALIQALATLRENAKWSVATRSALADEHLYAVQGWVPADRSDGLAAGLKAEGVDAAVQSSDPTGDDAPPTLLAPPWWARPIKGLFDILGTVPGYGEFDVSAMFMIFLPIFSAILISDTGYGLLYLLLPLIFYRKMAKAGAANLAHLIIVIGALSVIWGFLTCSLFGYDYSSWLGLKAPFIRVEMKKESINSLMLLSITLGAIHLTLAHLWKAKTAFPHPRFISNIGWAIWMWGIYGLVRMFMLKEGFAEGVFPYYPLLLLVGGTFAIIFADPHWDLHSVFGLRRLLGYLGWVVLLWGVYALVWHYGFVLGKVKTDHALWGSVWGYFLIGGAAAMLVGAPPRGGVMANLGLGLANFPLSAIGTFGDTISYLRLMAIGLAGTALAMAFNDMGGRLPIYAMIPILVAGHALNVSLSIISLFAHGVRLNMLEFSNNLGMQWSGYLYEPFSAKRTQEN